MFCIDFFNARVLEARKHKCEYIGKESPAYSKKRMGKEGLSVVVPTALWNNSFLCFTWLLFTWGVIDNGKIKLIRMNDETVEASYEAGGTTSSIRKSPRSPSHLMMVHILPVRQCSLTGLPGGM